MNVLMEVFLNTIWQTAAVALLAWAALRWLPRINAATREAVWWAVLAFVVLLPALRILPGERPAYREPKPPPYPRLSTRHLSLVAAAPIQRDRAQELYSPAVPGPSCFSHCGVSLRRPVCAAGLQLPASAPSETHRAARLA